MATDYVAPRPTDFNPFKKKYKNLMYDLETFGNLADSVIISLGGCFFDLEHGRGPSFNLILDMEEQVRKGRIIYPKTAIFWIEQAAKNPEAIKIFDVESRNRLSMEETQKRWAGNIEEYTDGMYKHTAWARGKEFDLAMVKDLWVKTMGNTHEPWFFRNTRDCRDMQRWVPKDTYKSFEESSYKGIKHNSEDDAITQAEIMLKCEKWLIGKIQPDRLVELG